MDISHLRKTIKFLGIVKSLDEELFWAYHYLWLETNPYRKLYDLQRLFSKAEAIKANEGKTVPEALAWYERELFCLSFLAVINVAFDCIDLEEAQIFPHLENRFYNVGSSKEGKLKVKAGIEKLAEQIDKLSKGMIKVPPISVVPTYIEDLARLVRMLIKNAPFVQSYLLINNNIFRTNLKGETKNLKTFTTADIQYKTVKEVNNLMLKIMYEGRPIDIIFKDFV